MAGKNPDDELEIVAKYGFTFPMADVVVDWYETSNERAGLRWQVKGTCHEVQFPAPTKIDNRHLRMVSRLEALFHDLHKGKLSSVAVPIDKLCDWDVRSLVTSLRQAWLAKKAKVKIILFTDSYSYLKDIEDYLKSSKHEGPRKNERVFYTKENIKICVYKGDILKSEVECIVNGVNSSLSLKGGLAETIAKNAGKGFVQECESYIKRKRNLDVGEVFRSSAGKLKYKCVVFGVAPCWKEYLPHTKESIDRCKRDLQLTICNSLKAASEYRCVRSIAFPAISSGKLGVPGELCCVWYAEALLKYSKDSQYPVKEVHFVDTDDGMIKMIGDAFESVINKGRPPPFYVSLYLPHSSKDARRGSVLSDSKVGTQSPPLYPYIEDERQSLVCHIGSRQVLRIYTNDILRVPKIDLIVCGDIPSGKSTGGLAKALLEKCGQSYRKSKPEAFKGKVEGDVVFCGTDTYHWVAHALLIPKKKFMTEDERKKGVDNIFHAIFDGMKSHGCKTMALPLIGTGKGNGDPEFYAERFIDSLFEFCTSNKSLIFDIRLVNTDPKKSEIAMKAVKARIDKEVEKNTEKASKKSASLRSKHDRRGKHHNPHGRKTVATSDHQHYDDAWSKSKNYLNGNDRDEGSYKKIEHASGYLKPLGRQSSNSRYEDVVCRKDSPSDELLYSSGQYDQNRTDLSFSVTSPSSKEVKNKPYEPISDPDPESHIAETFERTKIDSDIEKPKGNLKIIHDDDEDDRKKSGRASKGVHGSYCDDNGNEEDEETDEESDQAWYEDVPDESRRVATEYESMDVEEYAGVKMNEDLSEDCVICMEALQKSNMKILPCGHKFCVDCIDQQFAYKKACPTCGHVCGVITGDQPEGDMRCVINEREHCNGYEGYGRIEITYTFLSGRQSDCHPEPGKFYKGITRKGYLPNNKRGRQVLEMLKIAFERKLIFTIGRSRTTGAESVITWNDIHHKTDPRPNSQFGYPDPTYLDRVIDELKAKGVTESDIQLLNQRRDTIYSY